MATDFTTASTAAGLGFTSPPNAGYLAEAAAVVAATTSDPSTVTTQEAAITAYIAKASAVTFVLTTGADDFVGKPGVDSTFIGDLTSSSSTARARRSIPMTFSGRHGRGRRQHADHQ